MDAMTQDLILQDEQPGRNYNLNISPEWQNLIAHFDLAEGFAFIVLIVPDATGLQVCEQTLQEYLSAKNQTLEVVQFSRPEQLKDLASFLLELKIAKTTGAIWVSANLLEGVQEHSWEVAWREGVAGLNKFRNHLRKEFALPLIFAGSPQLQIVLREMAPDLWSVRTLVVRIETAEATLSDLIEAAFINGSTELDLANKELTQLPEFIGQLALLKQLDISGNKLVALPEAIGQLTQLRWLNLSDNRLTTLPDSMRNLRSLEQLFLHGNHALGLPAEVLGPTCDEATSHNITPAKPGHILEYYFRVRRGTRPLNEAKLILVGRGGVGKTSIVNQLVHNTFRPEKKTEGIKITEWPLTINTNEKVRLNVWDFGGQEIMHATHQFFLTHRSLYLLVLNGLGGGEDADAEYWLKLIEIYGSESSVIVVMNKVNTRPFDLNRRALQLKYPPIRAFIQTDCADNTGIKELRSIIELETDRLEHLRDAFPSNWFSIKEQLGRLKKNYLTFDEYRQICVRYGVTQWDEQDILAGYLHNLGIILHYKDDPRLKDTHVLNPRWVTNGIYKILNSDTLEKQKGEIRLNDLSAILDSQKYPENMHGFLFDLMKKFELCFSFPDDDTHYLIPDLLDKQEPAETAEFDPQECLNFQYHYNVLPEGLLPRFIVRTHVLSEGPKYRRWRTGVILEFERCRALVKADVQDKKVFLSITGPVPNRRRLLAVIRSDFERIHRDISNLHPREIVPLPDYPDAAIPYDKLLVMERYGYAEFPEVVGTSVIMIKTEDLLNGVDIRGTHRRRRTITAKPGGVRLFYAYSHKDQQLRDELETHLKLLQRQGLIETWHDRRIDVVDEWSRRIDDNLERADIILLLVSPDFIASDYSYNIEMQRALERHNNGEARVIPVIVRDVNWRRTPLAKLQALPKSGKPVPLWDSRDSAWRNVTEGIERVIKERRNKSTQFG